ncbi:MAG TPA: CRTAC1 family protein, partial [Chthonomonadaceae bacterium]|nr:CRTAC1 family protein [Chthonomonadaceae bacterium]
TFQNEPKSLYRNAGRGLFTYASYVAGIGDATKKRLAFGVCFADFDNDGHSDLLFANGHVQDTILRIHPPITYAQTMQLFRNQGNGLFADISAQAGPAFEKPIVGRAVAIGDYDNDGKMDALVVDAEGAPLLLHNESPARSHWLGVRVVSRTGNRDALGARLTLELPGGKRVAESQTCRSYLAACDPRLLFGLGAETKVTGLTVRWPSGRRQTFGPLAPDRYYLLREGEAPVPDPDLP